MAKASILAKRITSRNVFWGFNRLSGSDRLISQVDQQVYRSKPEDLGKLKASTHNFADRNLTMSTELETGLPSVRQVQTLIKEGSEVEFKLITGDLLTGKVRWQDPSCICLMDHYDQPTIIWRTAIVFMKPKPNL
jgi:host factor-I protein